jgi:hypothetical protein
VQTADSFTVHADVPGVAKEGLTVNVLNGVLTISGGACACLVHNLAGLCPARFRLWPGRCVRMCALQRTRSPVQSLTNPVVVPDRLAERKAELKHEDSHGSGYRRVERSHGLARRSLRLPSDADVDK